MNLPKETTIFYIQEKLIVELDKQLLDHISEDDDVDKVNTKMVSTLKNSLGRCNIKRNDV